MHYHGTPLTPISALYTMAGRNFCVSFASPQDVARCHEIGQSVMLDNGAFTFWRKGMAPGDWTPYETWAARWLEYPTTWAVIPDVIDGDEDANDALVAAWSLPANRSAPVWHMHESLDRLRRLAADWERVCIGSSGRFATPGSTAWSHRMDDAWNALLPNGGAPTCSVHMLRAMKQACEGPWPFASADSTNTAQNHHRHDSPVRIAERWDAMQAPSQWRPRAQLSLEAAQNGSHGAREAA